MSFTYPNLRHSPDAVRLINILPNSNPTPPVEAEIYSSSLDAGAYRALSYTWGDPSNLHEILLNNHPFQVTSNLGVALRCLRHASLPKTFWIDAICINQDDIRERSEQVQKMRLIYQRAQEVVIWLGDIAESGSALRQLFEKISMTHRWIMAQPDPLSRIHALTENFIPRLQAVPNWQEGWDAFISVLSNPWWERMWTLQEFAVASQVVVAYGSETFPWDICEAALNLLHQVAMRSILARMLVGSQAQAFDQDKLAKTRDFLTQPSLLFQRTLEARSVRYKTVNRQPQRLLTLLEVNWMRMCTDPRDKVFALIGLAEDSHANSILPDYFKTMIQVLVEVARGLTVREGNLDALSFGWKLSRPSGLPSWCSAWGASSMGSEVARIDESPILSASGKFAASGSRTPNIQFSPDLTTLQSPGFFVDRVARVDSVDEPVVKGPPYIEEAKRACANRIIRPPDLAAPYMYTQATVGDTLESAIVAGIQSGVGKRNPNPVDKLVEGVLPQKSYSVFVTECSYIGSTHLQVREGDAIVVLQGSKTPSILRRQQQSWMYVGICYGAFKDISR